MEETEGLNLCVLSMSRVSSCEFCTTFCKVYYSWVDKAQAWSLAFVEPSESFSATHATPMSSSSTEALKRRHARLT